MKFDFKKNVMPVIVLSTICIVVALALGVVNMVTKDIIEERNLSAIRESLSQVVPGGDFEQLDLPSNAPSTATGLYRDKISDSKIVTLKGKGFAGDIFITVGVDKEGNITKAVVTNHSETHNQAGMESYTDKYAGLGAEGVKGAELFSNATISSTAIRDTIYDAMIVLGYATQEEESLPREDEAIEEMAMAISGKDIEQIKIPESAPDTLKRLYKTEGGKVAYLVVPGAYVKVATEGFVYYSDSGKIIAVDLVQWVVGHGVHYTDEFLYGFRGKTPEQASEVELVAEATGTSKDFRDAVFAAVEATMGESQLPRIVGIAIIATAILATVATIVIKTVYRRRKNG